MQQLYLYIEECNNLATYCSSRLINLKAITQMLNGLYSQPSDYGFDVWYRDKTKSDIYSLSKAKTNYTQARQFTSL